ncbi:MAG TPA: S9 family peptidase [Planctomycetota bacterium]|jgi:dipeptidyl aminopeptidase/acylaminoacyl peptidase|nr:S9 family peptidase [Planctomycetota bacterium]
MLVFAGLLLSLAHASPLADDAHPFSVRDMLAMDRISDPAVSPDGKWVAYTVRVTDVEANKGKTDIWISAVDGSTSRQVTANDASDTGARWTSDGKGLVFLSTRSGSSQVWKIALDGGEAVQVTKLPIDVDNMLPFPDGKRFLLTMEVYADAAKGKVLEETAKRDADKEKSKVKAYVYESLLFRHWDTWEDGKRSHVFVWTAEGGAVDLMQGFDGDSPPKPFGGLEEVSISPDGKEVAFAAQRMTKDAAWSTDVNVYTVPADASTEPKCLTCDNLAADSQPCYSPDGKSLAWLSMRRPGYESDRTRLEILDRESGKKRSWNEAWDRSPGELSWSSDSKTLWTTTDNFGQHPILALPVNDAKGRIVLQKGTFSSPRQAGDRLLFAMDSLSSPVELYTSAMDGTDLRPVTKANEKKIAAAKLGDFEQFTFPGAKGENVMGFLVKPVDFKPDAKYPVAFLIHGGPQGSFGNHFHYRWNPQAYAGAGFAAVMIDFHGSTGYGQAFTDAINGDWGGAPYEDLMKGLDWALAHYPFLDKDRVAGLGASYGGYMINWIAGQTDRFKCLVSHDGNLDERMAYFDTEELWFPEWEHGGTPWEHPEGYAKHNPVDFVKNWKTPMLVVHGGKDYRVVDTQGLSVFTALQRKGVPSKLLYFPDENHWVLKPQNSILWHETVIDWIQRWTHDAKTPAADDKKGTAGTKG